MDAPAAPASTAPPLSPRLNVQLSVMMFLQYAIWGAWLPIFFPFLTESRGFTGEAAGYLFGIGAIGAIFAPFIAGQIADRYFNTEKFLAIIHILGAVLVWQLATVTTYRGFVVFGLLYSLLYAPTLALTNSLAFHHLPDRDRDFGKVRVWGTIGWIVIGIGIGQWLLHAHTPERVKGEAEAKVIIEKMAPAERAAAATDAAKAFKNLAPEAALLESQVKKVNHKYHVSGMADAFKASAILGVLLGVFCLMLPKTPPKPGQKKFAPWEALGEVAKKCGSCGSRANVLMILFLIAFPISCVHQFYFVRTSGFLGSLQTEATAAIDKVFESIFGVGGGGLMTIGQIFEIVVLAFMPIAAKRLSRKTLLSIGLLAYILRFFVFAYLPYTAAVVPALALHGVCFGCFFFVAFMIVDEETSGDVRASAQSLFNLVVIAFGTIVGNIFAGLVDRVATTDGKTNFSTLFSLPMWIVVLCFVALLVLYPSRKSSAHAQAAAP